jgi:multidrug resistance efflux pump
LVLVVMMQPARGKKPTTYTVPEHDRTKQLLMQVPQFRRYFEAAAATAAADAGAAPSDHQQAAQQMAAAAGEDSPEKQENRELRARLEAMELELQELRRYKTLAGLVCVCVCVCCVCARSC